MTAPATALLLSLLHATLVIVAAMIVRRCIPRRLAVGRVTVGVIGMMCLLVVTGLSFFPVPGFWPTPRPAPLALQPMPAPSEPGNEISAATELDPAADNGQTEPAGGIRWPLDSLRKFIDRIELTSIAVQHSSQRWTWSLLTIFLGGSAISLIRLCLAVRSVARLRQGSRLVEVDAVGGMVDSLQRSCGCRRAIELRESAELSGVATFGWLRPVILLPSDWPAWSLEELAAALAHEIAHIHRADYAGRLLALLGVAIHFYHPLVRRAVRQLAMDQEFASDRLARELAGNDQAYTRGLARLALRYHDSLADSRAWSNVSIMPRSSDFLARRLEMLRDKKDSIGKQRARWITCGASACVVVAALATALLRGATAADQSNESSPVPVAAVAAKPCDDNTDVVNQSRAGAWRPEWVSPEPIDLTELRMSDAGGFLIRLGDIARHPEIEPYLDEMDKNIEALVAKLLPTNGVSLDLKKIEWIAGSLIVSVKPDDSPDAKSKLKIGANRFTIRLTEPGDWQQAILDHVPGSTLETDGGRSFVQLPEIPLLDSGRPLLRFLDQKTILLLLWGSEGGGDAAARRELFDDTPRSYPWAETWRMIDDGPITVVVDNGRVGWLDLPIEGRDCTERVWPLFAKTKYFALGLNYSNELLALCTCTEQNSVPLIRQGALAFCAEWLISKQARPETISHEDRLAVEENVSLALRINENPAECSANLFLARLDVGWPSQITDAVRWAKLSDHPTATESSASITNHLGEPLTREFLGLDPESPAQPAK